ncbi:UvrD-helicase domain-containing protein [Brachybacterium hainanense]|uniref:DNA 3'-5' helicase n=1 Tax=Brachybacterium hainanense TaxID=1541174 RepID=A0ABV6RIL9_9MICO
MSTDRLPRLGALDLAALMGQHPPTPEQAAVIEAPLAPMLVVAGAGSGKTETMAARVVWLIANGLVQPRQVLGLTFTRKAAHELGERIGVRLSTLADALEREGMALPPGLVRGQDELVGQRPLVHTYNGFALDQVTEHALAAGLTPDFTMMSPSASFQLAHEIVEGWDDTLDLDASPASITAALISLTSSLADHLLEPAQLDAELARIREHLDQIPLQVEGRRRTTPKAVANAIAALDARRALVPLLERFAEIRHEQGALDFADQVTIAARIARTVPAAGNLARDLHRVVLLDEFQDTSVAQLELLAGLFGPGHATCAVGDPQQAIYGWRGASAASLSGFVRAFSSPRAPVLQRTLSTSWRNDRAPLAVANRIAAPLREASVGIEIPQLRPRPGAGEGAVWTHEAADERGEARAIAAWIHARRGEHDGSAEDAVPTAAVLVRARRQIPVLAEELEAAGLPVEIVGLGGLLHRPEVADVRALLECVHDPGRGDSLMRLLAGPRLRLGARDVAVLGRWRDRQGARRRTDPAARDDVDAVGLVDALDDLPPRDWTDPEGRRLSDAARARLRDLQELLRSLRRRLAVPLGDLVTAAVRALGLDLEQMAAGASLADLEAFRSYAVQFERSARHPGLGPFLALLDISEDKEAGLAVTAGEVDPDPAAVTLITMHSAKGLEWDLVAVAGLVEGGVPSYDLRRAKTGEDGRVRVAASGWLGPLADAAVPSSLRGDADILPQLRWAEADTQVDAEALIQEYQEEEGAAGLAEDRRLMYVAVTRARSSLLLTSAAWRQGLARPRPRSRYLAEALPVVPGPFQVREDVPEQNPLEAAALVESWPPEPGAPEQRVAAARELLARARAGELEEVPEEDPLAEAARRVLADLAARREAASVHSPVRLSASQIVRRAQDPAGAALDLLRPVPRPPAASARRGTAFHSWLEGHLAGGTLLDLEDLLDLPAAEEDELAGPGDLAALREAFESSPWAGRTPVAVEHPVTTRIGPLSVRGVIDAVYEEETPAGPGVIIVDWKTGRVPPPSRRAAKALQLSVYRLAWHEQTGMPLARIRTAFHYVAEGRTLWVEDHPETEELLAMLDPSAPQRVPSASRGRSSSG